MEHKVTEASKRRAYILGLIGVTVTLFMAVAVIWFWEFVRAFEAYGYTGAFLVSILGGAIIVVPVPMLAVVFALGGVMKYPVFVGLAAGLGETVGALTIYMTGYGGGTPFLSSRHGKVQAIYARLMDWMEHRGSLILFVLSAVLNPFFYPAALAAGALRFGLKRYFLICWAGKTVKGLTVAYAGYWGLRSLMQLLGMPV
ncbi:VTT domain-containing protein [Chloroflexota bacterium]